MSFDEPLNTDWDGNELLLSDILVTEDDLVSKGIDADAEREMQYGAIRRLSSPTSTSEPRLLIRTRTHCKKNGGHHRISQVYLSP